VLRWLDRRLLGFVMGTAAFVLERAVVRGTKSAAGPPRGDVSVGG
jgi:hypothetical protein